MNYPLYTSQQCRDIDSRAIALLGVDGFELMQRAARVALDELLNTFPQANRLTVCCGKGNNAGDGYLLAALAVEMGLSVQLIAATDPNELSGDAARAFAAAQASGLTPGDLPIDGDVIVDALLGTGLRGAPRSPYQRLIGAINGSALPVLSIDLPSGINADNGAELGEAVAATLTVTFIGRKIGLYTGAGLLRAGQVRFADLAVPAEAFAAESGLPLLRWSTNRLDPLPRDVHKYQRGHVLVVGGDHGMAGAALMAAEAALRVGVGLVTVVTHAEHAAGMLARRPELMIADAARIDHHLQRADAVVLGPGLGRGRWGRQLFDAVGRTDIPTVFDADGLYWLSQGETLGQGPLYITPHSGEAARLLACDREQVDRDRLAAAAQLRERFGARGIVKGAGTVVFDEHGFAICGHGNPGMATAGMGDVLAGVLGGLLACSTIEHDQAATTLQTAVVLHSAAADRAAQRLGPRSLLASDVINALPDLLREVDEAAAG